MGLSFPFNSCRRSSVALQPGDPDPSRFEILRVAEAGAFTVAEIRWPDARNFEGRKIAVYRTTPAELRSATALDPHFQEHRGPLVPIARFEPTDEGWVMATLLASHLR